MYKKVIAAPDWVGAAPGAEVYSLSGCVSEYFADYIPYWRHNSYWLFDSPEIIRDLAEQHDLDLNEMRLFYYEMFDQEYLEPTRTWSPLAPDLPFPTNVQVPERKRLEGYDVVTFSCRTSPECSPLSCNGIAARASANRRCLLGSLDLAQQALESGLFDNTEPGPFRIFGVYTVAD